MSQGDSFCLRLVPLFAEATYAEGGKMNILEVGEVHRASESSYICSSIHILGRL